MVGLFSSMIAVLIHVPRSKEIPFFILLATVQNQATSQVAFYLKHAFLAQFEMFVSLQFLFTVVSSLGVKQCMTSGHDINFLRLLIPSSLLLRIHSMQLELYSGLILIWRISLLSGPFLPTLFKSSVTFPPFFPPWGHSVPLVIAWSSCGLFFFFLIVRMQELLTYFCGFSDF